MPSFPFHGVFINYRREDTAAYAHLLNKQLTEQLPESKIFMDMASIEPGRDFVEAIESALLSCPVCVTLIGPKWLGLVDEEGCRRLDNPDDYVRFEIRIALERCERVIPVLVDGAKMPRREQLPVDLHKLARLNALEMSYGRFDYDGSQLLAAIQKALG